MLRIKDALIWSQVFSQCKCLKRCAYWTYLVYWQRPVESYTTSAYDISRTKREIITHDHMNPSLFKNAVFIFLFKNWASMFGKTYGVIWSWIIIFKGWYGLSIAIAGHVAGGTVYLFQSTIVTYTLNLNVFDWLGWQWCADCISCQTARINAIYVITVFRSVINKKECSLLNAYLGCFIVQRSSAITNRTVYQFKLHNNYDWSVYYTDRCSS